MPTGSIPGEIGNLTSLQHLALNDNELSGEPRHLAAHTRPVGMMLARDRRKFYLVFIAKTPKLILTERCHMYMIVVT